MERERNNGIDLLRIIAMFFVVILHALGHGGVLDNVETGSPQYSLAWALEIIAYPAVDTFALITGYVSFSQRHPYSLAKTCAGYSTTWLQVVYYCVLITIALQIINTKWITISDLIYSFFPVTNNMYWYFTAYTGVIVLSPLITAGVRGLSNKSAVYILIIILLVFSLFDSFSMRFSLNSGYSVIWLLLLYCVGAIMKKICAPEKLTKGKCVLCILILYILTWCWKIFIGGDIKIMTLSLTNDSLVSYTSPTIICISILYLALFAQIKTGPITTSVIRFLAPGAFSVYLLNDNRLIRAHYIEGRFDMIVVENSWHLFLIIVCFAIAFTIIALFVDKPRQLLFNKMLIKKRIEKCADRLIG